MKPIILITSLLLLISCNQKQQGKKDIESTKPEVEPVEYILSYSDNFAQAVAQSRSNSFNKDYDSIQKTDSIFIDQNFGQSLKGLDKNYQITGHTQFSIIVKTTVDSATLFKELKSIGIQHVMKVRTIKVILPKFKETTSNTEILPWGVQLVSISSKQNGNYPRAWVLDSGVDPTHSDLNIDPLSRSFVKGETLKDVLKHGTHVAGTIGAKSNMTCVIGVAPNAPICALKVISADDKINQAEYHSALEYVSQNCKANEVLNLSFISSRSADPVEERLIRLIASKKTFVVMAATNSDNTRGIVDIDKTPKVYPASINGTNIFTVSAIGKTKRFSPFSNYGSSVDYCQPGEDIVSTIPGGGLGTSDGTSMAAPHLSGLLLLKKGALATSLGSATDRAGNVIRIASEQP